MSRRCKLAARGLNFVKTSSLKKWVASEIILVIVHTVPRIGMQTGCVSSEPLPFLGVQNSIAIYDGIRRLKCLEQGYKLRWALSSTPDCHEDHVVSPVTLH